MLEGSVGVGSVLRLVRDGRANTRTELARQSGLSRSTLAERVQALLALGLLQETTGSASTGGRPPATLTFNRAAGAVLVADFDATHCRLAACDLGAVPLAEDAFAYDLGAPPERIRRELEERLAGLWTGDVRGVGLGLPAPVADLPGWAGFTVGERFDAPVLIDGHVNLMALGERWTHWRDVDHLLYVSVGARIDCGIVSDGRVHRGARGTAGDIGHMRVAGHDDVVCRCGNSGCLEALAGGEALAARLRSVGLAATTAQDVAAHARAGDAQALQVVRAAGRAVGEVLAACISFYNPAVIVLGGELAAAPEPLLAGVREAAFARSQPMATHELRLAAGRLGSHGGVIGAAVMVVEHVLAPEYIDRLARLS